MATGTTKRATTRKAPATKTTQTRGSAPKVAPRTGTAVKKPLPKVVKVAEPQVSQPDLRKPELIDQVVERSGIKKKDAKPVVEAMLAVLGESIAAGRELNLQPMGKLRINRVEEKANGRVVIGKIRQSLNAGAGDKEGLAEAAE